MLLNLTVQSCTRLIIAASGVKQYTLSTAWDLSTATLTTTTSVPSPGGAPVGITFKPDGTMAYIVDWKNGSSAYVYQWSLSTAWDASTLSSASKSINLHSQEPIAYEVRFNPNGTKMYAIGFTNDEIHQYSLSTAYDISTATYDTKKFDVSSQETLPLGFAFKPDGTKLYLPSNTNDVIYQYSTGYTPPASGGSNVQAFFAAAQYTGNGTSAAATQDITTDVDLSSGTGMVMTKRTDGTASWFMTDTVRGGSKEFPVTSAAEGNTGLISSFNSDGYTLTGYGNTNTNVHEYLSYTFKKQDHFFNCFQYAGNGTTQQIAHGLSSTPGLILVKRSGYHWGFWHKEFTGTSTGGYFNINSGGAARLTWFNDNTNVVDPTSTHFTVGSSGQVNGNGATYTAYVFGDNINGSGGFGSSGSEDIIKCGTYTGTGTTDGEEIDLGFQPQLFFFKNVTNSNLWHVFDAERGLTDVVSTNDPYLSFDNSNGETSNSNIVRLITDGIKIVGSNHPRWNSLNDKYIYVAIRKPMPTGGGGSSAGADIEDIFSIDQYDGNASTNVITNGVDLTSGGMVLHNRPTASNGFYITDTVRGGTKEFDITSGAELTTGRINSFNNNGYTLNGTSGGNANASGTEYISYTFKNQDNFFNCFQYTGNGSTQEIAHGLGSTPGLILVKRPGYHWGFWHKGFAGTAKGAYFNLSSVPTDKLTWFNNNTSAVDPTSTHFTVGSSGQVNGNGATYTCYVFADNNNAAFGETGDQDVIKCGTFVGSTSKPFIDLGFEPQFLMIRNITNAADWILVDTMRGFTGDGDLDDYYLKPSVASASQAAFDIFELKSNGVKVIGSNHANWNQTGSTYVYVAIRTSGMGTPTDVDDVFHIGDTTNGDEKGGGFKTDLHYMIGNTGGGWSPYISTRSITNSVSKNYMSTNSNAALATGGTDLFSSTGMDNTGYAGRQYLYFARAKGFLDVVCHSGTNTSSQAIPHGLQTIPEMIWSKSTNSNGDWIVYHKDMADGTGTGVPEDYYVTINSTGTSPKYDRTDSATAWNDTAPTATEFTVGSLSNGATSNYYVSYLWSTVDGISKVGSYSGNGGTQNIDCGFTAGARYVWIRSINSGSGQFATGSQTVVFDTRRGIVAGDDPYYHMGTAVVSGDITNRDMIDPYSSGFALNNVTSEGAQLNTNGKKYIFYAIA